MQAMPRGAPRPLPGRARPPSPAGLRVARVGVDVLADFPADRHFGPVAMPAGIVGAELAGGGRQPAITGCRLPANVLPSVADTAGPEGPDRNASPGD